ncbi:hypothetical protein SAMN05428642_104273 [Flaviramulus basaltis]|uniref:DUF4412 domain-containing protein n=1 Tax=Flaviramulus basaltis TaxID=369401 RepID=A0A1K2IQS2_9FLAO|nr:hypothetical protein [Flaviramulus basaltis]SFZ94602.1 hypothetical protein SAMN05428642_104273 [Flaviramulus basaltis]
MKYLFLLIILCLSTFSQAQKNYNIEIDGKTISIELDKEYEVLINKDKVKFKVTSKDSLTYKDDMLTFNYPKEYNVSSSKIDVGIEQLMLMTAEGSGFIIQKYKTINPSMLNEMMLNEITKESVSYGFELKREDYERTLKSGLKLKVCKAVLNYKDEINIYEIVSFGKKDEGILFMSMVMEDVENSSGSNLINMIWDTLEIY